MESNITQEATLETLCLDTSYAQPTPSIHLKTINDVRLEMASVYRAMKGGSIEAGNGSRLVYVLAQIGKMVELHDIEKRVEKLEGKL